MKTIEEVRKEACRYIRTYLDVDKNDSDITNSSAYIIYMAGYSQGRYEDNEELYCEIDNLHNLVVWEQFRNILWWHFNKGK